MKNNAKLKQTGLLSFVAIIASVLWFTPSADKPSNKQKSTSYIVKSTSAEHAKTLIAELGLSPTHDLSIIDAVAVSLTPEQLAALKVTDGLTITENYQVELSGGNAWGKRKWQPKAVVPSYIDADYAHSARNFGEGVTIGFLDTGIDSLPGTSSGLGLSTDLYGRDKFWGTYDAINNTVSNYSNEESGHGTHVASVAANADYDVYGKIYGVAPNAAIVGIKAFDADGKATYADVIRGIDWALQVKDQINLRVLNMSFGGDQRSYYWEDPLNQAVMKAWQQGIVVVASAGNNGPDPMTIGVPGNVPYIITVGAMTDNFTELDFNDDKIATFSAAGPTPAGFVKPDLVAPGGHVAGLMAYNTQIVAEHPEYHDGGKYFEMSGTSQAAAVVSGVAALMIAQDPSLTPDDVKCRLIDSAHTALTNEGKLAYSVFQQGSGVVNAKDALNSSASNCANQSLDIAKDLAGEQHFYGPANINENGHFYVEGLGDEYVWKIDESELSNDAVIWRLNYDDNPMDWKNMASTDAVIWRLDFETNAVIWRLNFETDAVIWRLNLETDAVIWRLNLDDHEAAPISINNWVDPQ
ncbi:S8 family peptidase [Thalassotalea sp. LPB0316]|uniref:S8 family peptidase n=1 Tax=Thalassotalea sp. LPB0316 TaxID=2769490 RepID=UPI001865AA25|nr:S8 family peptidase [Thalassotalea sp. LPB0316]QOL25957.1 S8 family peptidase [Thalassotalea sp. LPB0316]